MLVMLATVGMISSLSKNSGRSTPTTKNWFFVSPAPATTPFIVMVLPTTLGSEPKTRRQNP